MSNRILAGGAVLALWAVYAAALLWPGGLSITKHTGDALHMIAIVERLAQGQLPHQDFMTPIGIVAFWPIALLVKFGLSIGQAFVIAQVILSFLGGAAAFVIGLRRMGPWWAASFAALTVTLVAALVHGEAGIAVSVSMHYNRWAWALAFIAILAAVLPTGRRGIVEGVALGGCMAALALIKVTYFVALLPVVVLGLWLTGQRLALGLAVVAGLLIAGMLTLILGVGYWTAYLGDLLLVAGSDVRAQPGLDFTAVLTAPAYLGATLAGLAMVIVLRRIGFEAEGLLVLLLFLAGSYITYQNFGNDPQWLALLALLLAFWASEAGSERGRLALTVGAVAAAAFVAPSFVNMAVSPLRHVSIPQEDYMPILAGTDRHKDLRVSKIKANRLRGDVALTEGYRGFDAPEPSEPVVFMGEVLPDCRTEPMPGYFASITTDLRERGLAQGGSIFAVDIFSPYWLFGDHRPLSGGAPWYYDGLSGYADADFVLLPSCPILVSVRNLVATSLKGEPLTEVARTPLYTLYSR